MATRPTGRIRGWVAALAVAALASGTWALAQDGGNAADGSAPTTQQPQDTGQSGGQDQGQSAGQNQGPGSRQRPFARDGRGGLDRGFQGRGFDGGRGGPQRWRHDRRHDWHRGSHRRHDGDGRGWREGRNRGPGGRFGRPGMGRGPALAAIRLDAPLLRAFRQLNLSDAQRTRVRTILMTARTSARQQRESQAGGAANAGAAGGAAGNRAARAAANRQELAALRNPGDPNYARAVQAAKDRAAARIQRATQTQLALYNVLTPAQKTQLTQIFAQRRARLQQRAGRQDGPPA